MSGPDTKVGALDSDSTGSLSAQSFYYDEIDPFENSTNLFSVEKANFSINSWGSFSHANCACTPQYLNRQIFDRFAVKTGAIPTIINPKVRQSALDKIDGTKALNLLKNFKLINNFFTNLFITREKLESTIVGALKEELSKSSGGKIDISPNVNFDVFSSLSTQVTQGINAEDQANKWILFGTPYGFWNGVYSRQSSHQFLGFLSLLVEWQYLFGLYSSPAEIANHGAGLTVGFTEGLSTETAPYDPREPDSTPRIFTGSYQERLSFPSKAIDILKSGKISWTKAPQSQLKLPEQLKLWKAAAMVFKLVRPKNRGNLNYLYAPEQGLLDVDTHYLPLAFLPSLEILLTQYFLKTSTLSVFESLDSKTLQPNPVSLELETLVAFMDVISDWSFQLGTLSASEISDAAQLKQLQGASDSFKDAVGLAVIQFFRAYIKPATSKRTGRKHSITLFATKSQFASLQQTSFTLQVLNALKTKGFRSELLNRTIDGLFDWMIDEFLILPDSTPVKINQWTMLWLHKALADYKTTTGQVPLWHNRLSTFLSNEVSNWDAL